MLRRYVSLSVGALVLLVVLAVPGQVHAQRMRGGGPHMGHPAFPGGMMPGFRGRITPGFRPGFDRRFDRGSFDRRFDRRFENRFDRGFVAPRFTPGFGPFFIRPF